MEDPGMQNFTATGRPYKKEPISGWSGGPDMGFTGGQPHSLPWKFTDDDTISVPIHRPTAPKGDQGRKKSFLRKLFTGDDGSDVIIKQMTRGEYLKHYAKDEEGNYCGTEDPADDCVLKEGDRRAKHGEGLKVGHFQNDIIIGETKKEKSRWSRSRSKGDTDAVVR